MQRSAKVQRDGKSVDTVPASASAQMFRGDAAHTAVYPLDSAAHEGRNLVGLQWRFATEGDGISSPVVVGDRVYAGSGDGHLYALDRLTGATIWTLDAHSAIHSSLAAENGLVFFATRAGALASRRRLRSLAGMCPQARGRAARNLTSVTRGSSYLRRVVRSNPS